MAKKKTAGAGVSKTKAIKDQLAMTPDAPAAEIAAAASEVVGEKVNTGLVYNIKSNAKRKSGKKRATAKRVATPPAPANVEGLNTGLIKEAAALLNHAGSAAAAREALAVADEILKILKK